MQLFIISLAVIVIGLTFLFSMRNPEKASTLYGTFESSRKTIAAIFVIIVAPTFLRSGDLIKIGAALLMFGLATLYFAVERPDKTLV